MGKLKEKIKEKEAQLSVLDAQSVVLPFQLKLKERKRSRKRNRRGRRKSTKCEKKGTEVPSLVSDLQEITETQQEEVASGTVTNDTGNLQIINLSSYILTDEEIRVLALGLSFSPMNRLDKFTLIKDVYLFCRKLVFKLMYHQPSIVDSLPHDERQVFSDLVQLLEENELPVTRDGQKSWHLPSQITPSFAVSPSIQIFYNMEADKGGNIVFWPIDMYLKEARRQLSDAKCYQVLPSDPTDTFKKKLDRLLTSAKHNNILDNKEFKFLTTESPIVPTLYFLPKIHKSIQEPPGSYIQDTSHLIRQLQDLTVPNNTILVTMDVTSLYTCIGHTLGIEAVSFFLNQQITGDRRHQSFILDLLSFVLSNSYFVFDRTFYKQIIGTAMGARCAPSYANLFMGWWEETQVRPLPDFNSYVLRWFRYIDDLLFLWTGSETDCRDFITTLNSNGLNISLTACLSTTSVDFLDLKVMKVGNQIQTKIFRKTTATNNFLHFSSFHPQHLRDNLPKGQFLREN
ncbi:uncharacterized protein [Ranitomeya imitator]|uniref:uncharacterized protein n=1 Tax=Ranitomeya imitator TaxID=111125 RepID=UPI0037E87C6D